MLEDKRLKEAEKRIKQYIQDGIIQKSSHSEYTAFFLKNADDSIDAAKVLYDLSIDEEKQKILGYTSFNGFLWVVNASYYSMFYMARALLECEGIRIKTDMSVHAVTFDAIIHHFYLTGKLQKEFIQDFIEAKEDAAQILGKQKADELMEEYFFEKKKRSEFTYEMGSILVKTKAATSLERARRFRTEIMRFMKRR
jgi:uncharacterized protein (UPF0332 family)